MHKPLLLSLLSLSLFAPGSTVSGSFPLAVASTPWAAALLRATPAAEPVRVPVDPDYRALHEQLARSASKEQTADSENLLILPPLVLPAPNLPDPQKQKPDVDDHALHEEQRARGTRKEQTADGENLLILPPIGLPAPNLPDPQKAKPDEDDVGSSWVNGVRLYAREPLTPAGIVLCPGGFARPAR